eukprot:scaffold1527_cov143-Pinguiococcus_pyrenoidosus.AAC.4
MVLGNDGDAAAEFRAVVVAVHGGITGLDLLQQLVRAVPTPIHRDVARPSRRRVLALRRALRRLVPPHVARADGQDLLELRRRARVLRVPVAEGGGSAEMVFSRLPLELLQGGSGGHFVDSEEPW